MVAVAAFHDSRKERQECLPVSDTEKASVTMRNVVVRPFSSTPPP